MTTLERMKALLRRLSPSWPSTDPDTRVGKELDTIAATLVPVVEPLDGALDEIFPDTTTQLIDRWERITRNPVRTTDTIEARRARVLAVLRRTAGPRLDQLEAMLSGPLDLAVDDIIFIEQIREFINEGLTQTDARVRALSVTPVVARMGKPWPGLVDDTGVRLYVRLSDAVVPVVTLTGPSGATWTVPVDAVEGWYETRTAFDGLPAGGRWDVTLTAPSSVNVEELRLLVSNDVDASQIYNFFVYRDPDLAGDPNIPDAQRLFARTALAQMNAHVIERMAFIVGDAHSLVGREPVGV
jgi:hypothetical protein